MNNKLIVLMGTSGTGKSTTAEYLSKKGYEWISIDEIIKKKFPDKNNNNLNPNELIEAHKELYKKINKSLEKKDVVVEDWFYLRETLPSLLENIKTDEEPHLFLLEASWKNIIDRNLEKPDPLDEKTLKKHYNLSSKDSEKNYANFHPIKVNTDKSSPQEISEFIENYILFHDKIGIDHYHKHHEIN